MKNYQDFFKDKKITILGLGLLGKGLNDAKFLAECGADLIVTDLKTADQLKSSLKILAKYKNIKYVLGEHRLEDFRNRDFVLKGGGVSLDSPYIAEAVKNNIPVKMDASWFSELAPDVKIIGVTGTRGKTTTTYLIYELLKAASGKYFSGQVYLGGNIRGLATLPYLKKIKASDIVVMELDSWQLQGFGDAKISPNISVFTNLLSDHLNYYLKVSKDENEAVQKDFLDKANIFANQKSTDYLIVDQALKKVISERYTKPIHSQIVSLMEGGSFYNEVKKWKLKIKGEHNLRHVLRAVEVGKIMGLDLAFIKKTLTNFAGVPGRQELVREYRGIKIYNDTTATTPDATLVALESFGSPSTTLGKKLKPSKKLVLIFGGADKNLDMSKLVEALPKYTKAQILLSGTGTTNLKKNFYSATNDIPEFSNLKNAVNAALKLCKKGDTLILSPGFASFGMFKNEYDRGDKFVKIVKSLR